ncbi:MAG: hypothetical protein PHH04_02155 [Thomasclavelia sp.]|jgi:hypothetical protein|nr:hypothetical protein [Thomasclavelia sp.]
MINEVKACVDAKINYIDQYYEVPNDLKEELDIFTNDVNILGEKCTSATQFEELFVSEGLSNQFAAFFTKLKPKQVKMTKEQKKDSVRIAKDILKESKDELIQDELERGTYQAKRAAERTVMEKTKEEMIENDTFDDFTRASNNVEILESIGNFFKKKIKK